MIGAEPAKGLPSVIGGMVTLNLTVLEYHSHDGGPSLFSDRDSISQDEDVEAESSNGGTARKGLAALVGLVFLIGVAWIVASRRGDSDTEAIEPEQVNVTEYED